MTKGRYIGDNIREAITWAQDTLRTTRPIAEMTILSAIESNKVVWDNGVYLFEDDEEMERRKTTSVQTNQKSLNVAKKWSRIHFRNNNRKASGKNSLTSVHKQAASKFSNEAEDMLAGGGAALPSGSTAEENEQ